MVWHNLKQGTFKTSTKLNAHQTAKENGESVLLPNVLKRHDINVYQASV